MAGSWSPDFEQGPIFGSWDGAVLSRFSAANRGKLSFSKDLDTGKSRWAKEVASLAPCKRQAKCLP